VGDVSCGDDHDEGSCDDDGCAGDEGCNHDVSTDATVDIGAPVQAVVNGVAVLRDPGSTGEPRGTAVQVQIRLTDNGDALYADQIDLQINKFVPGSDKPELYRSGPLTIQQVRIHLDQSP